MNLRSTVPELRTLQEPVRTLSPATTHGTGGCKDRVLSASIHLTPGCRLCMEYLILSPSNPKEKVLFSPEDLDFERLSLCPALRWLGSDRVRLLGCWAAEPPLPSLPHTFHSFRDFTGTAAEGRPTASVFCFVLFIYKFLSSDCL